MRRARQPKYVVHTHQRPTLSFSLPPVPVDGAMHADLVPFLDRVERLYSVCAIYYAPDGATLALPVEDSVVYSLASGRAMVARAIQCQSHVEVALSDSGTISLLDDTITLSDYLGRIEQLSRAVNVVTLLILPGPSAGGIVALDALRSAWAKHAVAQQGNVHLVDLSAVPDAWDEAARNLESQRAAWN